MCLQAPAPALLRHIPRQTPFPSRLQTLPQGISKAEQCTRGCRRIPSEQFPFRSTIQSFPICLLERRQIPHHSLSPPVTPWSSRTANPTGTARGAHLGHKAFPPYPFVRIFNPLLPALPAALGLLGHPAIIIGRVFGRRLLPPARPFPASH